MNPSEKKEFRLMLVGGGTGGHLFPALATAEEICERIQATRVLFLGTGRKMDETGLAGTGYSARRIYCYGLKGKKLLDLIKAFFFLPVSFIQACYYIMQFRPNVVFGVGGYVSGPVVAAAKLLGKRTIIHEQNSVPGMANRKLGKIADTICISLPHAASYFPSEKCILTGNPVRKEIVASREERERQEPDTPAFLVLGGSLGAHRVNELVVEAVRQSDLLKKCTIYHQTGSADEKMVQARYRQLGVAAEVSAFFTDMAAVYRRVDLLVSRAGATTLAELAVLGKPALLIPYPYAADDHQRKNGEYYVAGGGCKMFVEKDLTPSFLAGVLENMLKNGDERRQMSEKMRGMAMPDAAAKIAEICLK